MGGIARWLRSRIGRSQPRVVGCLACGVCCELYGHTLGAAPEDRERWQTEGRSDLLARVGPEGELWLDPETGERLEHCPFLDRTGPKRGVCGIHETKPLLCREYPTSVHGFRCVLGVRFPSRRYDPKPLEPKGPRSEGGPGRPSTRG